MERGPQHPCDWKTSDFDFDLPESLIAYHPPEKRDGGRLLVLDPGSSPNLHRRITDLPEHLPRNALLVLNDTRVIKARLEAVRPTGGAVELLLVRPQKNLGDVGKRACRFEVLMRANRPIKPGDRLDISGVAAAVRSKGEQGEAVLDIDLPLDEFLAHADRVGQVPLPPYIKRAPDPEDAARYQTIYAAHNGSSAAPTAGLHFTKALLDRVQELGGELVSITLHVGPGTFRPVKTTFLKDHRMDKEEYFLSEDAVSRIARAKSEKRPVIAVGTTATRALEGAFASCGRLEAGAGFTELFITPGFTFHVVDGLITNFHLPKSTLLSLVSALVGRERILSAYAEAVEKKYRFYSFGDAMLILPRKP